MCENFEWPQGKHSVVHKRVRHCQLLRCYEYYLHFHVTQVQDQHSTLHAQGQSVDVSIFVNWISGTTAQQIEFATPAHVSW